MDIEVYTAAMAEDVTPAAAVAEAEDNEGGVDLDPSNGCEWASSLNDIPHNYVTVYDLHY